MESQNIFLGNHSFPVLIDFIPMTVKVAEEIAALLQFDTTESYKLQMAVEEAVKNVIDHYATKVSPNDFFELNFAIADSALVVSIFEKGIPFKKRKASAFSLTDFEQSGLGMHMLNSLMDKVELLLHGRNGKETRLTKYIDMDKIPESVKALYQDHRTGQVRQTVKNYTIRMAMSDDIENIIQLAWKCYGYSQVDKLYNAETLAQMLTNEEMISYIAVNDDDNAIICHIALKYESPKVPEMGFAFVDPTYRCPGIMLKTANQLKMFSIDRGDDGIFDRAATTHTYSQKELQEIGAKPCSMMMGFAPTGMQANMTGTTSQFKGSTMNHYNVFNRAEKTIYPPNDHKEMICKIYEWMEIPRVCGQSSPELATAISQVVLVPQSKEYNVAYIMVEKIGQTSAKEIFQNMNECIQQKMDACYLFISLHDQHAPALVESCEKIGFSFAGVMPHIQNGQDCILMQKLNVKLEIENIRIYSDNSRLLFQYILDELNRTHSSESMHYISME